MWSCQNLQEEGGKGRAFLWPEFWKEAVCFRAQRTGPPPCLCKPCANQELLSQQAEGYRLTRLVAGVTGAETGVLGVAKRSLMWKAD